MRLLLPAFLLFCTALYAQPRYDFQLWKGVEVQKNVNRLQFTFLGQLRLNNNANTFGQSAWELCTSYEAVKRLNFAFFYTYSLVPNLNNSHQLALSSSYQYRFKEARLRLMFRLRCQVDFYDRSTTPDRWILRPRVFVRYEPKGKFWKRWSVGCYGELFLGLNAPYNARLRYRIGGELTFDLSEQSCLTARYFVWNEYDPRRPRPEFLNIVQIGILCTLPDKKKKNDDDDKRTLPNIHY